MTPAFPLVRVKTPLLFLAGLAVATLALFALSLLGKTTYSPDVWTTTSPSAFRMPIWR